MRSKSAVAAGVSEWGKAPPTGFDGRFAAGGALAAPRAIRFLGRLLCVFLAACAFVRAAPAATAGGAQRLKLAIVQMAFKPTLEGNRDVILAGIGEAAAKGARVAVFPEGALNAHGGDSESRVGDAVGAIRRAARTHGIYVVMGGVNHSPALKKMVNWMKVIAPDGGEVFHYDKLYNHPRAPMPGVFEIDGVPCGGMICADRWLRGVEEIPVQQGAVVSFELSNNFACEWVGPFGWYWNVPRAMRNSVWVVLANTGNRVAGQPDESPEGLQLRHGHSAVIAPDGRIVAAAQDETSTIVMAEIDVSRATRAEAIARANHPVLGAFWQAGLKLQRGESVRAPPLTPLHSPEVDVTVAVAQVTGDLAAMKPRIAEARSRGADLVVFPARAISADALAPLQAAAREHRITVIFGAEYAGGGGSKYNSAFVIGPDGTLLTRYDQLSANAPHRAGTDPAAMWFRINGVPAVVTIGRDGLWNELAELAAVAGTQIHVHLDHDASTDADARLRRLQVASNMASFRTFAVVANVTDSSIWDDVDGKAQTDAFLKQKAPPDRGQVEVDSIFSANLVASARSEPALLVATRRVAATNGHLKGRPRMNPQMEPWYRFGAALLQSRGE